MINTIIVEDNTYMQRHFANMISEDPRFYIVGVYRDAFEAESVCGSVNVDLVLMDVQTLHNHSGLAAGKRIKEKYKKTRVMIMTSLVDPDVLEKAKDGAADSLWYKDHGDADIMDVIERTLAGEHVFPDESPNVELNDMLTADLSKKQLAILRRFVQGYTYDEIAEELQLSRNGVRWNLDQIVEKGGFANKHELLAAVIENKLIVTTLKE